MKTPQGVEGYGISLQKDSQSSRSRGNSIRAVEVAAEFARQNDGTVVLFYVVPTFVQPTELHRYVPADRPEENVVREKLEQIARKYLRGVEYEIMTDVGSPATAILSAATTLSADVIVMATHGAQTSHAPSSAASPRTCFAKLRARC